MDNKENLENVVMDNNINVNEVNSPLNEKIPSKNKKPKKHFSFKKKKNDNNVTSSDNMVNQSDIPIVNNEVFPVQNSLPEAIEVNNSDIPAVNLESSIPVGEVGNNDTPINDMPLVNEENNAVEQSNNLESTPIFDPNALEAATSNENIVKQNEDNFVPPADFTSIFNVTSEENTAMPASVRLDKDINESVNSIGNSVTEANSVQNTNGDAQPTKLVKEHEKKKEVFNSNEKVLYEIKPEKEGNPIVVILFFLFLLSSIVILPYISKKVDFKNGDPTPGVVDNEEDEDDFFYFNRSSVRAVLDGLEFTNFVKHVKNGEYFLTFNISNKNDRAYQYDKKYYVVFYDGSSIVYRALIHAYDVIGSNAVQEITLTINERGFKSADRFKVVEIPTSTYPTVEVTEKDGDYSVLKCNYRNDEMKYYFLENKLVKLVETYTETMEGSSAYENDKAAYKILSDSYKRVNNFSSTFVETNTRFTMINEFNHRDIADATLANLKTYKFFKYNENINTVSFELEAQGYTCG